jgi:hypothetical protein
MVAEEVFVNCYKFNTITSVKKVIFKVFYKTIEAMVAEEVFVNYYLQIQYYYFSQKRLFQGIL